MLNAINEPFAYRKPNVRIMAYAYTIPIYDPQVKRFVCYK